MTTNFVILSWVVFMSVAFIIIVIGVYTGWNFDIEKANSNYNMEKEILKMEKEHLLKLLDESKTTTNCEVLKNIRLEILANWKDLDPDNWLKNHIKEMAKERYEIICL